MTHALPALSVLLGAAIVAYALQTAIRTFVLPQPGLSLLSRTVFRSVRPFFNAIDRLPAPESRRGAWASVYAPLCMMLIVFLAMVLIGVGFTLILYGLGLPTLQAAFLASISSVSTLGFADLGNGAAVQVMATIEATTGILIVALLIGYLPTIYASVQQREQALAALEAHVGTPLSGAAIVLRYARSPGPDHLDALWKDWSRWFVAIGESHNTLAGIIFVRSPQPQRSWVTTAGAVLDAAALAISTLDPPRDAEAERCLETGSQALRQILDGARSLVVHELREHNRSLHVTRADFDAAYASLATAGLPVTPDRTAAWANFAEWRGQYDDPLSTLSRLTKSPMADLSADPHMHAPR